jgi:hypothetical protein
MIDYQNEQVIRRFQDALCQFPGGLPTFSYGSFIPETVTQHYCQQWIKLPVKSKQPPAV